MQFNFLNCTVVVEATKPLGDEKYHPDELRAASEDGVVDMMVQSCIVELSQLVTQLDREGGEHGPKN